MNEAKKPEPQHISRILQPDGRPAGEREVVVPLPIREMHGAAKAIFDTARNFDVAMQHMVALENSAKEILAQIKREADRLEKLVKE